MNLSGKLKLSLLALTLLFIGMFVSSRSILEVTVLNVSGGIKYSITKSGDKASEGNSESNKFKRIVSKGEYEVRVTQGNKSLVMLLSTKGFFKTTSASVNLQAEKQRQFVGGNPSACMFYTDKLYSLDCGGAFQSMKVHMPATDSLPSYISKPSRLSVIGLIKSLEETKQGNIALVQEPDVEGPGPYVLYHLDKDLNPINQYVQRTLAFETKFSIAPYLNSFIIYSDDLSQVYSYDSVSSQPVEIKIDRQNINGFKPGTLRTGGGHITLAYTNQVEDSEASESKIIDINGRATKSLTLTSSAAKTAVFCGQSRVCVVGDGEVMEVYSLDSGKRIYSVRGVYDLGYAGDNLLLFRDKDILNFNADSGNGSVEYSYGGYSPCGYHIMNTNTLLVCIGSGTKTNALVINRGTDDSDGIDKKILDLQKFEQVNSVSIYKNRIFVSPKSAPLSYRSDLKILQPDETAQNAIKSKVSQFIDMVGINKNAYKLTYTL